MDQELIIFPSLSLTFGGCSWSSRSWSQPSRSWSQPARSCSQLLPAIQKLSAIQMLLVLRAHLLFGRRNHTGRLGKRSRMQSRIGRRIGRRRTGLRRAGNRSGRRRAGRRRTGHRKIEKMPEYCGGNACIEGQIMSLKQEGRWVGGEPSTSLKQLRLMTKDCWFCSICMLGGE